MSEYFDKVPDRRVLLDRERAPLSGRRVRKDQAKRHEGVIPQHGRPRWLPTAVAAGTLTVLGGAVVIARSGDSPVPAATATTITQPASAATVETTAVPDTSALPSTTGATVAPSPSTEPTPSTTALAPVVPASFRMVGLLTTSNTTTTPLRVYPKHEVVFNDASSIPTVFICDVSGCRFSLRDVAPGTVTADGSTSIPVVDGRMTYTVTGPVTCPTGGATGQETNTIDLILSGSQVVNGVTVPTTIVGTHTLNFPEMGDVTATSGCPGFTGTSTLDGTIAPG